MATEVGANFISVNVSNMMSMWWVRMRGRGSHWWPWQAKALTLVVAALTLALTGNIALHNPT